MTQLAIKGHATRGKEVIEILKMLGGIMKGKLMGTETFCAYYIDSDGSIDYKHYSRFDDAVQFTLEEFLEKFPYKVEDKVIYEDKVREVTKMIWEEQTNTVAYKLDDKLYCNVIKELQLCKEENMEEIKMDIPKGYEFAGVDDDKRQVVFTKIQPHYPKTYEECCEVIHSDPNYYIDTHLHSKKLGALYKLIICRDAYWNIAGEQMGLGKPWSPSKNDNVYCIFRLKGEIVKDNFVFGDSLMLEFPTEEMRDAFYENFKELIEQCKELL